MALCLRALRSLTVRRPLLALAALSVVALVVPAPAAAQSFGRNKVHWESFEWQTMKTEHFDLYYYPEERQAVADAGRMAERWYSRLSQVFGHGLLERKPLIFYADASDFEQTEVVGGPISQGIGGVTEPLRSRVTMPLAGSYQETDHVLGHELVHVFQYEILLGRRHDPKKKRSAQHVNIPTWFIEGMAEYLSQGRHDPVTAMWLRDALLRDDLPDLGKLTRDPRYFAYRWGEAFWAYIGGHYGDDKIVPLFSAVARRGVDPGLKEVLGISAKDFADPFRAAIRETYQKTLERRTRPQEAGRSVLPRDPADRSRDTYVAPAVSPDGSQVIFFSTRGLVSFDLYLASAATGEVEAKLATEEGDPHFDALRFLDSAGSFSPDGRKFAFVVFAEGDNQIAILDVPQRKIERRIGMPGVGAIWNPAWSPDGAAIAFSGSDGGITDLYLLDVVSGKTRKLTGDRYADLQPAWSPDGKTLAFASDRGPGTSFEALTYAPMGIFLLDVASGRITPAPLPETEFERINPQYGPRGELYFVETRDGVNDLFRATPEGGLSRLTSVATGISGITRLSPAFAVAARTGQVVLSVFEGARNTLHSLAPGTSGQPIASADGAATPAAPATPAAITTAGGATESAGVLPPAEAQGTQIVAGYLASSAPVLAATTRFAPEDYHPQYKANFVGPAAGVSVGGGLGLGVGGNLSASWSDMLERHVTGFTVLGTSGFGSLSQLGAQGFYLNQGGRWNYGVQAGHIPYFSGFTSVSPTSVDTGGGNRSQGQLVQEIEQTALLDQVAVVAQYPFSTTRRFESSAGITRISYQNRGLTAVIVDNTVVHQDTKSHRLTAPPALTLYQGSLALVGDTSYFGYTSPIRGHRWRLAFEPSFGDLQFQSLSADYRHYTFLRPLTLAVRGLALGRVGRDAENSQLFPLYLGDQTLVRGYDLGAFDLAHCTPVPGKAGSCAELDRLLGSRVAVANFELRLPLVGSQDYGLIHFPILPTDLAFFVDAGTAWTRGQSPLLRFARNTADRVPVVSAGVSARILLGGVAVLHFYVAKPFQLQEHGLVTGFFISPGW